MSIQLGYVLKPFSAIHECTFCRCWVPLVQRKPPWETLVARQDHLSQRPFCVYSNLKRLAGCLGGNGFWSNITGIVSDRGRMLATRINPLRPGVAIWHQGLFAIVTTIALAPNQHRDKSCDRMSIVTNSSNENVLVRENNSNQWWFRKTKNLSGLFVLS